MFIYVLFVFNLASPSLVINFLVLFLKFHLFAMELYHLLLLFFKLLAQSTFSVDHLISSLLDLIAEVYLPGALFLDLVFDELSVLSNVSNFNFLFFCLTFKVYLFVLFIDKLCPQIINLSLLQHLFLLDYLEFFLISCRFDLGEIQKGSANLLDSLGRVLRHVDIHERNFRHPGLLGFDVLAHFVSFVSLLGLV